jgi:hypothetical protein
MICSEIDEAFSAFNVPADKYKSADGQLKPIPDPVTAPVVDDVVANAKKNKVRKLASLMQAKRLNAVRTQLTADDMAMAFHLANR